MPTQTTNLFLLEELDDVNTTSELARGDLEALRAVGDWLNSFIVRPHKDLGRVGPVCPFVPVSLERQTLWLAPEHVADRDVREVVELMSGYKRLFLDTEPTGGEDADYKVIVVVFTDLPADRAQVSLKTSNSTLQFPRMRKTGSCSAPSARATRGLRSTTRASAHSNRPCRSCS